MSNTRNRMTTKTVRGLKRADFVTRLLVAASDSDVGGLFSEIAAFTVPWHCGWVIRMVVVRREDRR